MEHGWITGLFKQLSGYLELDVWIIATSSTDSNPYIAISENIEDGTLPCDSPIITLGTKSNCHYQSLLPIEMFHLEFKNPQQDPTEARELFNKVSETETERNLLTESESRPQRTNSTLRKTSTESSCRKQEQNQESKLLNEKREKPVDETQQVQKEKPMDKKDNYIPFVHTCNGKKLTFHRMSDDYTMKCPTCLHETRYIIQHLNKGKCQNTVHIDNFKIEFKAYKEMYTDADKITECQNKWKS